VTDIRETSLYPKISIDNVPEQSGIMMHLVITHM